MYVHTARTRNEAEKQSDLGRVRHQSHIALRVRPTATANLVQDPFITVSDTLR